MSSSRKKVIVRRFVGPTLPGYLPLSGLVRAQASPRVLDLLDLEGRVQPIPLDDVKHICYVRDFNLGDNLNPERLTRRTFLARPRTEGLWVRLTFRPQAAEPDLLEGLAPIDAAILDDAVEDAGLFLVPPDTRANVQRIYVPRSAILALQLIAVITTPSRRKPTPAAAPQPLSQPLQDELFKIPLPPNSRPN